MWVHDKKAHEPDYVYKGVQQADHVWGQVQKAAEDFNSLYEKAQAWGRIPEARLLDELRGNSKKVLEHDFYEEAAHPLNFNLPLGRWVHRNFGDAAHNAAIRRDVRDSLALLEKEVDRPGTLGGGIPLSRFVTNLQDSLDRYAAHINRLLNSAGPRQFKYLGFQILNPDRMPDHILKQLLAGVDFVVAVFKRRGVLPVLQETVTTITLRHQSNGESAHGLYFSREKRIEMMSVAAGLVNVRMLREWVSEVFLHEVGHHVHLSLMHPEAKAVWDSGWAQVAEARKQDEATAKKIKEVSFQDRERFWNLLIRFKGVLQTIPLKGLDRMKFHAWLRNPTVNDPLVTEKQLRWSKPYGVSFAEFFQDPEGYVTQTRGEVPGTERFDRVMARLWDLYKGRLAVNSGWESTSHPILTDEQVAEYKTDSAVAQAIDALEVPTDYAKTNEKEDFAESFVAFMSAPERLSAQGRYRMLQALSLSGLYGKQIMRLAKHPALTLEDIQTWGSPVDPRHVFARSYDEYVDDKKSRGEKPLSHTDWSNRQKPSETPKPKDSEKSSQSFGVLKSKIKSKAWGAIKNIGAKILGAVKDEVGEWKSVKNGIAKLLKGQKLESEERRQLVNYAVHQSMMLGLQAAIFSVVPPPAGRAVKQAVSSIAFKLIDKALGQKFARNASSETDFQHLVEKCLRQAVVEVLDGYEETDLENDKGSKTALTLEDLQTWGDSGPLTTRVAGVAQPGSPGQQSVEQGPFVLWYLPKYAAAVPNVLAGLQRLEEVYSRVRYPLPNRIPVLLAARSFGSQRSIFSPNQNGFIQLVPAAFQDKVHFGTLVHELAHYIHFKVLPSGKNNPDVLRQYQFAKDQLSRQGEIQRPFSEKNPLAQAEDLRKENEKTWSQLAKLFRIGAEVTLLYTNFMGTVRNLPRKARVHERSGRGRKTQIVFEWLELGPEEAKLGILGTTLPINILARDLAKPSEVHPQLAAQIEALLESEEQVHALLIAGANQENTQNEVRYQQHKTQWFPTDYAKTNEFEWFAELVTARIMAPGSMDDEVVVWVDAMVRTGRTPVQNAKTAARPVMMVLDGTKINYDVRTNYDACAVGVYAGRNRIAGLLATREMSPERADRCKEHVLALQDKYPQVKEGQGLSVYKAFITDETKIGLGIGKRMYIAAMQEWFRKTGPFLFFPSACNGWGSTSKQAMQVWGSLARAFPSQGPVIAVLGLPQMPAVPSLKTAKARYKEKKEVPKADGKGTTTVYVYSEGQVQHRNREKAQRVEKLRGSIEKLRSAVAKDLKSDDEKTRLIALAVALMDHTYERVGNDESAKEGHFGVTGWTKDHISFKDGKATIKYVGKSGVKQNKTVTDKTLVSALKAACEGEGDCVTGSISASDVNQYLKSHDITAKDIRGYHANTEVQTRLKAIRAKGGDLPKDPKEKTEKLKKEFQQALEETADLVGHKATTLKSQYLVPGLERNYVERGGEVVDNLAKQGTFKVVASDISQAVNSIQGKPGVRVRIPHIGWLWTESHDSDDSFSAIIASYEVVDGWVVYKGRNGSEGIVVGTKAQLEKWADDIRLSAKPATSVPWDEAVHGGGNLVREANQSAQSVLRALGVSAEIQFWVRGNGGPEGAAAGNLITLWNVHKPVSPVRFLNGISLPAHMKVAAHEAAHLGFHKGGRAVVDALKVWEGEYLSTYHALAGHFEGAMEAAALYALEPRKFAEAAPEVFAATREWFNGKRVGSLSHQATKTKGEEKARFWHEDFDEAQEVGKFQSARSDVSRAVLRDNRDYPLKSFSRGALNESPTGKAMVLADLLTFGLGE